MRGATNSINSITPVKLYDGTNTWVIKSGNIIHVVMYGQTSALSIQNLPKAIGSNYAPIVTGSVVPNGAMWIINGTANIVMNFISNVASYGTLTYITDEGGEGVS